MDNCGAECCAFLSQFLLSFAQRRSTRGAVVGYRAAWRMSNLYAFYVPGYECTTINHALNA